MASCNNLLPTDIKNMKGMVVSHLNIRSLLKHKDESFLHLEGCDVICFTETWLTCRAGDQLLAYDGYKYIRQDRPKEKRGGGLIVYIREVIFPYVIQVHELCYNDPVSEEVWLRISKPGWKKLIIGLIYRPPSGNCETFNTRLDGTLMTLHERYNFLNMDVIILGDLNINFAKNKNVPRTQLTTTTRDRGLYQLIKKPTRVTNKTKSIIDLIFTNIDRNLIRSAGVIEIAISDHMPIFLNKKAQRCTHPKKVILTRNYSNYSKEMFKNILFDSTSWVDFWRVRNDPNQLWSFVNMIIVSSVDILCPIKKKVIRSDQHPWVDKALRQLLCKKERQYRKAKSTNSEGDWELFRVLKVESRKMLIQKKREYITAKLYENRDDPKIFWQEMDRNLKVGKSTSATSVCERIEDKSGNIVTGENLLPTFNDFYASVGQDLAKHFPLTDVPEPVYVDLRKQCNFRFVGLREVNSVIKRLKNNKSSCVESINTKVLKEGLCILLVEFTHLINECLDLCVMPTEWKVGTVSPIPKGPPSLSMGDYRPISVLPAPSKVIERIVYNQLVYYLESNCLLDVRQHGFRKDHSTVSAIMEVVQFMYERLDEGYTVHCAYIDYSKAFDTLNHDILCVKLCNLGFSRQIVAWCRNYLTDRYQSVKMDGKTSSRLPIKCGVPQGSILGPLFFIVYVNDLFDVYMNMNVHITLYADDTVLYVADKNPDLAATCLEEGLCKLSEWCILNKLTVNVKKTKHMVLTPPGRDRVCKAVNLNGEALDTVRTYNYLGVDIDDCLTFQHFLKQKCNKVNSKVYQMGKLRKFITRDVACLIYKQTILPLVEYADIMVESGPTDKITRLQTLQDRALRIIDNKEHQNLDVDELSVHYRILPLKLCRSEHLGSVMYRLSKNNSMLEYTRPRVHLRNHNKIKFKVHKRIYEKYLKSPLSRGITVWDRIPESIQRSTTKVKFKNGIQPILTDLTRPVLR